MSQEASVTAGEAGNMDESPALRWGDEAPTSTADARGRLIDAARTSIDRFGLSKTTLEDIATEASVSRQTVYRYFANRDELLAEALLAELEENAGPDPSEERLRSIRTPDDAVAMLADSAVFILEAVANNPKLSGILASEGDSVRATLDGASGLLFDHYTREISPWLEVGQRNGLLNPDLDPAEMCEWVLRITLSLLSTEGPVKRNGDDLRTYLTTYLTPVFAGPRSL
jgi:AcrR family transcriptional regulator